MEEVESAESAEEQQPGELGGPAEPEELEPQLWGALADTRRAQVVALSIASGLVPGQDSDIIIEAILIAGQGDKFWLRVPGQAWPRRKNRRMIPLSWVGKAFAARVQSLRSALDDGVSEYVSVALLSMKPQARDSLSLLELGAFIDVPFSNEASEASLPDSEALWEACAPHVGLASAAAPPTQQQHSAPAVPDTDTRLADLERSVGVIRGLIEGHFSGPPIPPGLPPPSTPAVPPAPAPLAPAKAITRQQAMPRPKYPPGSRDSGALDPVILRSAAAAGVDPSRLANLGHILRGPDGRLPPEPGLQPPPARRSEAEQMILPLVPESAAEADDVDGEACCTGDEELPPVERALLALTKITGQLASGRTPQPPDPLERALEGLSGSVANEVGGGASANLSLRKGAAARRALVEAVTARPEAIYGPVERLMVEAIQGGPASHAAGVGSGLETPNPFVYLEHRSRVANYRTTVSWMWQLAAIHKALIDGRPEVARARVALALAAGEQFSLDQGSWTLAWEMTLLDDPPCDSFARHVPDPTRMPFTRLMDPRWLEVHLARLRDQDDLQERRRRLAGNTRAPAPVLDTGNADGGPKPKPKYRPKQGAEESPGGPKDPPHPKA